MASRELFKGRWLSLREVGGYEFVTEHRTHAKVAVLGFQGDDAFLLRYESCAGSESPVPCSLTGSVDAACESVTRAAVRELFEESGYKVEVEELISLGSCRPYKAASAVYHLFAVDLSGAPQREPTDPVDAGFCEWVDLKDLVASPDPMLHMMYLRLLPRLNKAPTNVGAPESLTISIREGCAQEEHTGPGLLLRQYELRKRAYQEVVDFLDGRSPGSREEYEQAVESLLQGKSYPEEKLDGTGLSGPLKHLAVQVKGAAHKDCYYDVCQRLGRVPADEQEYTKILVEMTRELDSPGE